MTELTARPKHSIATLIWLIVSQLMALGSLLIWATVAGLSVMAVNERRNPAALTFILAVWAYPLFPLVMATGACRVRAPQELASSYTLRVGLRAAGSAISFRADCEFDWAVVWIENPLKRQAL